MLLIGSHVSFDKKDQLVKSTKEAISYNATTFMFYTGAPQNTNRSKIDIEKTKEAVKLMAENNIDYSQVIVHAPYIINLANINNMDFSIRFLVEELARCNELGIDKVVLHPGSHVGLGIDKGIENIIFGLNKVFDLSQNNVKILLETMAGKGSEIGSNIDELEKIIDGITNKERIGICLDTCHLNDAGYDLTKFDELLTIIDNKIGLDKVMCIHINDSKNQIASHKDRHENIGLGTIGFETLNSIVHNPKLSKIPKILETPYVDKEYPPYKYEIEMLRENKMNNNLLEDIRKAS